MMSNGKRLALSVLPVVAAILLGQVATFPNLAPWYAGLAKPSFNPPNWIFGPVWFALYALMAIAVWRVLDTDGPPSGAPPFFFFFCAQSMAPGPGCFSGCMRRFWGFAISCRKNC